MITTCLPALSKTMCDGVSFPVSFPSITIAAPAGLLETESIAVICANCSDTELLAPEANDRVWLAVENPVLVAEIECWPGAIPVNVHGVWHRADPSNVTSAPTGVEFTVNCAGTTAGAGRDLPLRPRGRADGEDAVDEGCASSAASSASCDSGAV